MRTDSAVSSLMQNLNEKIQLIMALRRQGITSSRVLSAIETIPRENFVSDRHASRAYEDRALPIDCGQTISQPFIVAYMTEQLEVGERDRVLEVGTGSGYQAAILTKLCRRVYSLERYPALIKPAEKRLQALNIANFTFMLGDGERGWPEQAPFDRIIVTAACPEIIETLVDQLKIGGIMIQPVGDQRHTQTLVKIVRTEDGYDVKNLIPVVFVPLVGGIAQDY